MSSLPASALRSSPRFANAVWTDGLCTRWFSRLTRRQTHSRVLAGRLTHAYLQASSLTGTCRQAYSEGRLTHGYLQASSLAGRLTYGYSKASLLEGICRQAHRHWVHRTHWGAVAVLQRVPGVGDGATISSESGAMASSTTPASSSPASRSCRPCHNSAPPQKAGLSGSSAARNMASGSWAGGGLGSGNCRAAVR